MKKHSLEKWYSFYCPIAKAYDSLEPVRKRHKLFLIPGNSARSFCNGPRCKRSKTAQVFAAGRISLNEPFPRVKIQYLNAYSYTISKLNSSTRLDRVQVQIKLRNLLPQLSLYHPCYRASVSTCLRVCYFAEQLCLFDHLSGSAVQSKVAENNVDTCEDCVSISYSSNLISLLDRFQVADGRYRLKITSNH